MEICEQSLNAWEQDNIEILTSKEMGAWLARRDKNREKSGKWEKLTHYARPYRKCSNCGDELLDDFSTRWNYCPTCGAYMKGRKEA